MQSLRAYLGIVIMAIFCSEHLLYAPPAAATSRSCDFLSFTRQEIDELTALAKIHEALSYEDFEQAQDLLEQYGEIKLNVLINNTSLLGIVTQRAINAIACDQKIDRYLYVIYRLRQHGTAASMPGIITNVGTSTKAETPCQCLERFSHELAQNATTSSSYFGSIIELRQALTQEVDPLEK